LPHSQAVQRRPDRPGARRAADDPRVASDADIIRRFMSLAVRGRLGASVIAIGIGLLSAGCSAALDALPQRHRAARPPPAGVEDGKGVYLIRPLHSGASTFTGGTNGSGLRQAFTADGLYLEVRYVFTTRAVWIPMSAIAGCSRSLAYAGQLRGRTNLWIE